MPRSRPGNSSPRRAIVSKVTVRRRASASMTTPRPFWNVRDFEVHDATNRLEVTLQGNQLGGYREYLKVPEQWTRDYQRLRSKNEVAQTIDSAVTVVLVVGMIVIIVIRVRHHDVNWRR